MDASHEVGHAILHRRVKKKLTTNPALFKLMEAQAFRFAGAFLLPATSFTAEAHTISLDVLKSLKVKWVVAIQAMIMRASHLGLLNEAREANLWRAVGRRGWRTKEPLDDIVEPERPRLLRRSFDMLIQNGIDPAANLSAELCIRPEDMETVCGLPPGYLATDRIDDVIVFPGAAKSAAPSLPSYSSTIIQFPKQA
jgi:Zn-dependent peptidase ImmA (M78 family)